MYKALTDLLDHPYTVERLISAKTHEDFMKILLTE
jgi:mannitol/fructose-specific phosphotransferase system IIA component (Ntr-type)